MACSDKVNMGLEFFFHKVKSTRRLMFVVFILSGVKELFVNSGLVYLLRFC